MLKSSLLFLLLFSCINRKYKEIENPIVSGILYLFPYMNVKFPDEKEIACDFSFEILKKSVCVDKRDR